MSEVPLYSRSGKEIMFDPHQVLGTYVCPTVGAYEPTHHLSAQWLKPVRSLTGPIGQPL